MHFKHQKILLEKFSNFENIAQTENCWLLIELHKSQAVRKIFSSTVLCRLIHRIHIHILKCHSLKYIYNSRLLVELRAAVIIPFVRVLKSLSTIKKCFSARNLLKSEAKIVNSAKSSKSRKNYCLLKSLEDLSKKKVLNACAQCFKLLKTMVQVLKTIKIPCLVSWYTLIHLSSLQFCFKNPQFFEYR